MASMKFKKGDMVIVNDDGKASEYEILSPLAPTRMTKGIGESPCYEAKEVTSGRKRTITEDEILRLATPVDSSERLFSKSRPRD